MMTAALPRADRSPPRAVAAFDGFNAGNYPHGERACVCLTVEGKIDFYDLGLSWHSPVTAVTTRVLTITARAGVLMGSGTCTRFQNL
jgi:hypothetical protein